MAKHIGQSGKPTAAPKFLVGLTSVNGVLDINSGAYTEGPADYVTVYNSEGAYHYDPAAPIYRLDQPSNTGLPFPPSPFIGNVPGQTTSKAASTADLRIVVPTNPKDTSAGAAYDTSAIFSATIQYFPDNSFTQDELGNPILKPAYLVTLS